MNDIPLLWLIYLISYSDTKHAFLNSRQHLHINMDFIDEDRILIEILYIFKRLWCYGAKRLKEFPNKGCGLRD